ncbi:MAG: methyltransferase domain-containing protein [Isosphaerales bacterium]
MTTTPAAPAARPKFDNQGQYSRASILRYEMIFGAGYVSTGGAATTDDLCARLGSSLRTGVRVLDVGSGIGGAAFHLAQTYGARVTGIDLAEEMVAIALERARERGMGESVTFLLGDVLETPFAEPFDIIWSRDAFMHIRDKARLFGRLHELLAGGGRLVITDYARGKTPGSPEFEHYIETTGYDVLEPSEYGRILQAAGFNDVVADDATARFIEILESERDRLVTNRAEFLTLFSEADLTYLVDRWEMKVRFCRGGDMKWGNFLGSKMSSC